MTTSTQEVTTAITDPDYHRALSVTGNQASVYGNVVITGRNWKGRTIQETILASGVSTIQGNLPFAEVLKIQMPARVAVGDTISVGVTDKLGFTRPLYNSASASFLQLERKATGDSSYTVEGTGPTVNTTYNTFLPNGGITGNDSFKAHYLTDIW